MRWLTARRIGTITTKTNWCAIVFSAPWTGYYQSKMHCWTGKPVQQCILPVQRTGGRVPGWAYASTCPRSRILPSTVCTTSTVRKHQGKQCANVIIWVIRLVLCHRLQCPQQFRFKCLRWRECRAYVRRCLRRRCCRRCSTGAAHRHVVRYRIHFLVACRNALSVLFTFHVGVNGFWFPSSSVEWRAHKRGRMRRVYSCGPLTATCCTTHP